MRLKAIGLGVKKPQSEKQPDPVKRKFTLSKKPKTVEEIANKLDTKAAARKRYAEERGLENHDCSRHLADLNKFAKVQVVTFPSGKVKELPVIVPTMLGEPLDTTGVTITRWLAKGMLPEPVLATGRSKAYHLEEVASFIRILSEHQQQFRQYRADHTEITDRLFRENALLRKSLFNV